MTDHEMCAACGHPIAQHRYGRGCVVCPCPQFREPKQQAATPPARRADSPLFPEIPPRPDPLLELARAFAAYLEGQALIHGRDGAAEWHLVAAAEAFRKAAGDLRDTVRKLEEPR